jgi:integrase
VQTAPAGRYFDGDGLWLTVTENKTKQTKKRRWTLRFMLKGKSREMGLTADSLSNARLAAAGARKLIKEGRDPIEAKRNAADAEADKPTFGEIADAFIDAKSPEWRNDKHKAQWKMTLETYAGPLRGKPVDTITTADVLSVLKPIWQAKPETASRVRGRIESVLDAARAHGHTPADGANPARWRGHLDKLLPKRTKLSRGHHAALPYADVPTFMAALKARQGVSGMALEFAILTAARSGEVLGAKWEEIDLDAKVWTIPGPRMKAGREHRVPLSGAAVALLMQAQSIKESDFVFPGARAKRPLSTMALEMVLRRMGVKDVTVHGFRSSFRDWAGNETHFPRELAEQALAHAVGDMTEQAYRRGDAVERRRALMAAWANHVGAVPGAEVTGQSAP